ncbi:hypothetical protein SAMN02745673_03172 [Marinactinospora thermotolerans DSM 45154]|uniref:Uncharacterized protein n=1 Tax=Marinactinospora thermotolerans DSM 45154 TaxID=1122192 RepID=A0A1T4S4C4_9ACTN|nr:hypothetical protein [Marinactinospora thermotolerans]SKA23073.1 hypothetical protein SAMN02745673_03172 [Marinactinospora thermotolerans DSM 45154]
MTASTRQAGHLNALRVRLDWLEVDARFIPILGELQVEHPDYAGPVWVSATERGAYVMRDGFYRRALCADPHKAARQLVRYFQARLVV